MAKKPVLEIDYNDLMASKVSVSVNGEALYYLDPAPVQGEFILRPIPKPVEELQLADLPKEWRRPKPPQVIDWVMNNGDDLIPATMNIVEPTDEAPAESTEPVDEEPTPTDEAPAESTEPVDEEPTPTDEAPETN